MQTCRRFQKLKNEVHDIFHRYDATPVKTKIDELPVKPDSSHVNEQRMEELLIVGTEQVPVKDYLVWSWINFILSLIELIFILFFCMKNQFDEYVTNLIVVFIIPFGLSVIFSHIAKNHNKKQNRVNVINYSNLVFCLNTIYTIIIIMVIINSYLF